MNASTRYFRFDHLLTTSGWLSPGYVGVSDQGIIVNVSDRAPENIGFEAVAGIALPGFQNAHSHAFQYAMAGLAEVHPAGADDDFWTWREAMYQCALTVNPDQAEAIAAMVYAEMVRNGYTHVAEFHYLHHDPAGKQYSSLSEMGQRMVRAARQAGIAITLVPVFYQQGGFGQPPQERQRRFISKTRDAYFQLLEDSKAALPLWERARLGFSVHSLRAVTPEDIIGTWNEGPKDLPFHLHLAEQKREVADCLAFSGQRPAQWLLDHLPVSSRFFLVHSTHLDEAEQKQLAASGAHVVLCPSTEGNLGDGIFPMKNFVRHRGKWCIGTDSHIGLNPLEEFRMIDYHQRLVTNHRNTFDGDAARTMITSAYSSGRAAMGESQSDFFAPGTAFDAVVYKSQSHLLEVSSAPWRLATLLYTSDSSRTLGTIIGGKWIVKDGHHVQGRMIKDNFSRAMASLNNR